MAIKKKPTEIAFYDIKHIIIDILLVECRCMLLIFWSVNIPNTYTTPGNFALGVHEKESHHNFVAANIAAIILSRSVCSDPYSQFWRRETNTRRKVLYVCKAL